MRSSDSIYGDAPEYLPSYDKPKEKDRREPDKRERERGGRERDHHRYHDRDREHNRDRDRGRKREPEKERTQKRSYFEKPAEEVLSKQLSLLLQLVLCCPYLYY